jgi:glycosyltransferase involved in cell wall biosynthesis
LGVDKPSSALRIVLLGPSGNIGGAERVLLDCVQVSDGYPGAELSVISLGGGPLVAAVNELGAHSAVVRPPASLAALGDSFASAGSVVLRMLPVIAGSPAFMRRFSRALSAFSPDLVHSHGIKTHVLGALLSSRTPVIWHIHDYLSLRSVSARLLALLSRRCSLAIAVSESVAADARRCLPDHLRVHVVHNSVNTEAFRPEGPAADLDTMSGLQPAPEGTIRIGLPATFARWKGHETFLEALSKLDRPQVRGYVIGAPLYGTENSQWSQPELASVVKRLGLDGRIGFTGLIDDMPAAYRALDIVVHASTRPEPFGLVIVEAMACGRALVAMQDGGAGELFVPERHALTARPGDAGSLVAALRRLVDQPEERAALGLRARSHVVATFGRERFATNLRAALSSALPAVAGVR